MTDLNRLRDEMLEIAVSHGFTEATVGEDMVLIHSEVSEALEDHREGHTPAEFWYEEKVLAFTARGNPILVNGKQAAVSVPTEHPFARYPDGTYDRTKPNKLMGIPSEMADVLIRVLHFAGKHGIDIKAAVETKASYNRSRPFKHGKTL